MLNNSGYRRAMLFILAAACNVHQAIAAGEPAYPSKASASPPGRADFGLQNPSADARRMAQWIVGSGDSDGMPFVIIDKVEATVFVFQADGHLAGATPALLGLAKGDDSVPGIGTRKISSILPAERTTPAGRYVASLGRNAQGKEILWIDYDAAISLHAVVTSNPKETRLLRLATPTPLDNRISYGCVNVAAKFYTAVVSPAFRHNSGVVYVLPETRSLEKVFPSFALAQPATPL